MDYLLGLGDRAYLVEPALQYLILQMIIGSLRQANFTLKASYLANFTEVGCS